jgi:hypothetical protein
MHGVAYRVACKSFTLSQVCRLRSRDRNDKKSGTKALTWGASINILPQGIRLRPTTTGTHYVMLYLVELSLTYAPFEHKRFLTGEGLAG